MDRREMLGALGAGAAGLVAMSGGAARADHEHHEHDEHIRVIYDCAKTCNEAAHHCMEALSKGGPHADHHARSHTFTMDCQAFCVLTAALMARSSPLSRPAHQACAEACRQCAEACEGQEDQIMKDCVKACRDCEKVCRDMAGAH